MIGFYPMPRDLAENIETLLAGDDFKLFHHLIRRASFKDTMACKKGWLFDSLEGLSERTNLGLKTVRNGLRRLEKFNLISVNRAQRRHDICILNYDQFNLSIKERAQDGHETGTQGAPLEEVKTLRREEKTTSYVPSGTKEQVSLRFIKPTAEEATTYARSLSFRLDGAAFCDFYESKGWKVGSTPMKDWKAAVRTWKRKHQESKPYASHGSKSIDEQVAERRRTERTTSLGKVASAGEILAGLRNMPNVQSAPRTDPGAGDGTSPIPLAGI
jgi:hypothetical protein